MHRLKCIDCTGTLDTTEYIVVDGNGDGIGDTECLNGDSGNVCTLVVFPVLGESYLKTHTL